MLSEAIQEAVKKNLSGDVGVALQAELKELELLRARIKDYEDGAARIKKELDELRSNKAKVADILNREVELTRKEQKVDTREKILEIKEGHAKESVGMMRDVVRDIFSNSKFKYQETIYTSENGFVPGGSTQNNINTTKTTEVTDGKT